MSEVYAEIYYDDSDGDECGVRYRVSKDDNAFTFGGGTNITEAWGLFRLLNYEYTSVKFDGTRLKTKFSDNTYSFVVDKN